METQLVVIGGGPGGYSAAFLAADLGMRVVLVDMESQLGGVCLLRGCIPSKALLHVAKAVGEIRDLADWGVNLGEPTFEVDTIRARKNKVIDTLTGGLGQLASRRKVKVVHARAAFADPKTLQLSAVDGEPLEDDRIRFDHCIVATGSSPASLDSSHLPTNRIMNSTGALALADVPQRLLVVGGGYIGLEMATVYSALGSRVSVVELTDGLLPGADRDLVRPLQRRLDKSFEVIRLKTKVAQFVDRTDSVEVTLQDESGETVESFDRVLASVGRKPNSDGLGLENTLVKVDEHGFVEVDHELRTADRNILAIGDVTGQPMLAHRAAHQGKVAVEVLAGKVTTFEPRAIPAVVFTDPEIAWAGLTETEAKRVDCPIEVARFPWAASGRAHTVARTEGMTKWVIDPRTDRVVGCGIVGVGAGDLIGEAVLAIEMGAEIRDLVDAIHPHPTLTETLGAAAEVYLGTATDLYKPKRTRKPRSN